MPKHSKRSSILGKMQLDNWIISKTDFCQSGCSGNLELNYLAQNTILLSMQSKITLALLVALSCCYSILGCLLINNLRMLKDYFL